MASGPSLHRTTSLVSEGCDPILLGAFSEVAKQEGTNEIGSPLRCVGIEGELSTDDVGTVWDSLLNSERRFRDRKAVLTRRLVKVHRVQEGDKVVELLQLENMFRHLTYGQYMDRVRQFASGLMALMGAVLPVQSRVVLYGETQRDWLVSALAAFSQNLQVVTLSSTVREDSLEFILNQSRAPVCITDGKLAAVLSRIAVSCPHLALVVTFDPCTGSAGEALVSAAKSVAVFSEIVNEGRAAVEARAPRPQDVAVVMYTSGTTGAPKGVMLSHSNLVAAVSGLSLATGLGKDTVLLAYLPLSHVMELVAELAILTFGASMGYGSPDTLFESSPRLKRPESEGDAALLKPTILLFVPAIMNKVYKILNERMQSRPRISRKIWDSAVRRGTRNFDEGKVGVNVLVNFSFSTVQKQFGGKVTLVMTGSAPLSAKVQRFMQTVLKAPVRQGYGLTETCAIASLATPEDCLVRSVGPPAPGSVIRLANWAEGGYLNADADNPEIMMPRGEVLVGGPTVCMGYLIDEDDPDHDLQQRNETDFLEIEGVRYFRTGDIGQITPGGTLQIIDRKKDLWKTPHGEYVALSKVEAALQLSPFVEIPMVYGKTGSDYLVALICPYEGALQKCAEGLGLRTTSVANLCTDPVIIAAVLRSCHEVCDEMHLSVGETPRKLCLLQPDGRTPAWTTENGLLAAGMKLRRPELARVFAQQIEHLYV